MPGWPLPTFCTASMASTRTVSTARSSSSVQSSLAYVVGGVLVTAAVLPAAEHRVGSGAGNGPDAGRCASWPSLLPHVPVDRRLSVPRWVRPRPAGRLARRRTRLPASGLDARTQSCGRRVGPRTFRPEVFVTAVDPQAACVAARCRSPLTVRGRSATGSSTRHRRGLAPPRRSATWSRRVRRAHQAAHHRAAAAHHRAGDVPRRAAACPSLWLVVATVVGGTLSAGSANALNCVSTATSTSGCAAPGAARCRGTRSTPASGAGVRAGARRRCRRCCSGLLVNWLSAGLALAANVFYVVGYTMVLKRRTAQNIVWGGAAGCFPALIGWTAVTGSLAWPPVVLFLVVFFWTPPHFWALAMRYRDDYAAADVPMLPVVASPCEVGAADRDLRLADGRDLAAAVAGRRHRAGSTRWRPPSSARLFVAEAHALWRAGAADRGPGRAASRCGSSTGRTSTWRCSSSPSRSTR